MTATSGRGKGAAVRRHWIADAFEQVKGGKARLTGRCNRRAGRAAERLMRGAAATLYGDQP
jgi:hypothetical protein